MIFMANCCLVLIGCGVAVTAGRIPELSRLESQLRPQVSTQDDVIEQLGEPFGTCGIFLPFQNNSGDCLYYYREESSLEDMQRFFLFVMIEDGLYNGYMWFSSFPTNEPTPVAEGERIE
jgi:hypothetical protein